MVLSRKESWSGYSYSLLQGTFLTLGSNPGIMHCKQMLYHLSHKGSPHACICIYLYIWLHLRTYMCNVYLERKMISIDGIWIIKGVTPLTNLNMCWEWLNTPAVHETQETWVWSVGWEDPLEREMATDSSILAWEPHRQKSLVGYSPWSCKQLDTTEHINALRT